MKYILTLVFTIFLLSGCGTTQQSVQITEEQPETAEKPVEKPAFKVIKYKLPVVSKEIRKYHTGDIDVYKTFEYESGTDILVSSTTYDSADEKLDYITTEKADGAEKHTYYNSSNEIIKTKIIKKDNSGNIAEITIIDSKGKQISRSEYSYTGNLKDKWSIFDSNNAPLAYNTYEYDNEGNNTVIKSFSAAGKLEEYFKNSFDKNGNLISSMHYDSEDKLLDSSKHIYENSFIKEESFYKGEKALQRKKMYSYNSDYTVQTCEVSIPGGQVVEIIEKEFFFIDKEKTIMQ